MIPFIVPSGGVSTQVGGTKDTSAPVLRGKGLTALNITDAIGTAQHDTSDPSQLFAPFVGGWNEQAILATDRHSIGTFHGRKCLRAQYTAGQPGHYRYNSMYLGGAGYDEFGVAASIYIPSDVTEFELINSTGGGIGGKTFFGISCGVEDCYNPNASSSPIDFPRGGRDQDVWPDDQNGCVVLVGMAYGADNSFGLSLNPYIIGGRQNGTGANYRVRPGIYSIRSFPLEGWSDNTSYWTSGLGKSAPKGQWLRVELYGRMDTDAMNGAVELYVNGTLWAWVYNCDLGGWSGDRRNLTGSNFLQQGNGSGDLWTTGGGWKWRTVVMRETLGGDPTSTANIPRSNASYYAADWYVLGKQGSTVPPDPEPNPSTKTVNFGHPDQIFWLDETLKNANGISNVAGTNGSLDGVPLTYRNNFTNPGVVGDISIVDDASFGVMPDGSTPKVLEVHILPQVPNTDQDIASGNRSEIQRAQDKNGSVITRNVGQDIYMGISIYVPSANWSDPGPGWFYFHQTHGAKYPLGSTFNLATDSTGRLFWETEGGTYSGDSSNRGTVITRYEIFGASVFPKDTWIHLMVYANFSQTSGQARTIIRRFADGIDTDWTTVADSTTTNAPTGPSGTESMNNFTQGVYRAGQPFDSIVRNPYDIRYRSRMVFGTSWDGVNPYTTTIAVDNTPNVFDFTDLTGVALDTTIESDIEQVTGISDGIPVSIVDGGFRIGNANMSSVRVDWSSNPATINNGEYIQVRQRSPVGYLTSDTTTLTVGSSQVNWTITTLQQPVSTFTWGNQFTPPTSDNWVIVTVNKSLPKTGSGSHQTEYAPVSGQGDTRTYEVTGYPQDCDLLLVGDGTIMDMPLYLGTRVRRLHVLGVGFDLDWSLGYLTNKNDNSGTYRIARNKTPFHVSFTHSLTIEGCFVQCNGLAIDIIQLPGPSVSDATDHATRDVYVLNCAMFNWSGVGPGFHGDFFHTADNSCRRVYVENCFLEGSYNDITSYPLGGVNGARQFNFRNTVFKRGPAFQGTVSNNFRLGAMEETPTFHNTWHPWGFWRIVDGGAAQTDPQLFDSDSSSVPSQDEIAPADQLGGNYRSPFFIQPESIDLSGFDLIWNDEFDGPANSAPSSRWFEFDGWTAGSNKWRDTFYDRGDAFLDGNSHLRMRMRLVGSDFHAPYLQTYDWGVSQANWSLFGPGRGKYFECSFKIDGATVGGPWFAFWIYSPENTYDGNPATGSEIDIFEQPITLGVRNSGYVGFAGGQGTRNYNHNALHLGDPIPGDTEWHNLSDFGIDIRDGNYHTAGLYWDNSVLRFYIDGVQTREITTNIPTSDNHAIILSIEYDAYDGSPFTDPWDLREIVTDYSADLPQYVDVDYVRVYEIKGTTPEPTPGVANVILDTDFGGDVDDAGAVAALNQLMANGECNILAMGSANWDVDSVDGMSAINDFYGHSSIPIGRQSVGVDTVARDRYSTHVAQNFPHSQSSSTAPSSTELYRQTLAAQPDNSVTFVTVGPLQNIKHLFDSGADQYSSLSGVALFNQKVKSMHVMGGEYPNSSGLGDPEYNFRAGGNDVTRSVIDAVTKPIVFNGFSIGVMNNGYGAGSVLNGIETTNPVAAAYWYFLVGPNAIDWAGPYSSIPNWSTWDIITCIVAVRGVQNYFGSVTTGYNQISADGHNTWQSSPDKAHTYLTSSMAASIFASTIINPLIKP